jgi:hypothetical protein
MYYLLTEAEFWGYLIMAILTENIFIYLGKEALKMLPKKEIEKENNERDKKFKELKTVLYDNKY